MKTTITICIGNTDDKLPQARWSAYCAAISDILWENQADIQFYGHSLANATWQNATWVVITESEEQFNNIQTRLMTARQAYDQDSIAFVAGQTEFI